MRMLGYAPEYVLKIIFFQPLHAAGKSIFLTLFQLALSLWCCALFAPACFLLKDAGDAGLRPRIEDKTHFVDMDDDSQEAAPVGGTSGCSHSFGRAHSGSDSDTLSADQLSTDVAKV